MSIEVPLPGIIVSPLGSQATVSITSATSPGTIPTVYSDPLGVNVVTMPRTITSEFTFYVPSPGAWTVNGVTLTLEDGQVGTVVIPGGSNAAIQSLEGVVFADSGITDNAPAFNALTAGQYWVPPVNAGGYYGCSEVDLGEDVWLIGGGHHPSKSPGNFIPAFGSIYGSNLGPAHNGTFTDCVVKLKGTGGGSNRSGGGLTNIGVFGNYDNSFNGGNSSLYASGTGGIPSTTAGGLVEALLIAGNGCELKDVFLWGGAASCDLSGLTGATANDVVLDDVKINQLLNVQGLALGGGTWNSSTTTFTLSGAVPAGVTVGMLITPTSGDGLLPAGSYISAISGSAITVANRYSDTFPTYNGWTKLSVDPYWLVIPGCTIVKSSSSLTIPSGYQGALNSGSTPNQWDGWSVFSGDSDNSGFVALGSGSQVARGGVASTSVTMTVTPIRNNVTATCDIVAARSLGWFNGADGMATGKLSIEGGTLDISSADFVVSQLHLSGDNPSGRGCGVTRTGQGPTITSAVFDGSHPFEFHMRRDNGFLHLGDIRLMNGNTSVYTYSGATVTASGVTGITVASNTIAIGQQITGTGIPSGTAVGSFTSNSITFGNGVSNATPGSGVTVTVGNATNNGCFVDNGKDAHSIVLANALGINVGSDEYRSTIRFTGNATPSLCQVNGLFTDSGTLQAGGSTTYGGLYLGGSPGKAVGHWANGVLQADITVPSGLSMFSEIVAGSYTYTIPAGATWLKAVVVGGGGGGGGGGSSATGGSAGGGGGAGAWNEAYINVSAGAGETITVTVGAAGTGGAGATNGTGTAGTNGARSSLASGTFSLASTITANGGSAGLGGASSGTTNGGDYGRGGGSQTTGGGSQTSSVSGAPGIGSLGTAVAGGGGVGSATGGDANGPTGGGGTGGQGGNSSSTTGWGAPGSPGTSVSGGASSGTGGAASAVAATAANAAASSVGAGGGGGGGGPESATAAGGTGGNGGPGGVYIWVIG